MILKNLQDTRPEWIPKYLKYGRKFIADQSGDHRLNCLCCGQFFPESGFYKRDGVAISKCKSCKTSDQKKHNYWNKAANRKKFFARCRFFERQSQTLKCNRCGSHVKRSDWPRDKNGHLNKSCCLSRLRNLNQALAEDLVKICLKCELKKDISEFTFNSNRSCHHPFCKDCVKSSAALVASRKTRRKNMDERDDGTLTKKTVGEIFGATKNCPCCDKTMCRSDKHLDHIQPLSRGGIHSIKNVMVLCRQCNLAKHAKTFADWYDSLSHEMKKSLKMNMINNANLKDICSQAFDLKSKGSSNYAGDR